MQIPIKAGVILAVLVTLTSATLIATGLHENFIVLNIVSIVVYIAINVGVVFWALKRTAAENTYRLQLRSSLVLGVVGGLLVFLGSWLLLAVVFPGALPAIREGAVAFMEGSGMTDPQVLEQMESLDAATPLSQSIPGGFFTVLTSLVSGAIIGAFQRKK